jgi:hypothetical protein
MRWVAAVIVVLLVAIGGLGWYFFAAKPGGNECAEAYDHLQSLVKRDGSILDQVGLWLSNVAGVKGAFVDECTRNATRWQVRCLNRAQSMAEVDNCGTKLMERISTTPPQ